MLKITGIYRIYCVITGKSYIGQSKDIEKRWQEHDNLLKKGKHHSKSLQKDYNKYGDAFFIKEIIKLYPYYDKNTLNKIENFYICYYNSYYKGYNETRGNNWL